MDLLLAVLINPLLLKYILCVYVFEREREKGRGRNKKGDRDKEEEKIMLKPLKFTGKKSYSADSFSVAKKKKTPHISLEV